MPIDRLELAAQNIVGSVGKLAQEAGLIVGRFTQPTRAVSDAIKLESREGRPGVTFLDPENGDFIVLFRHEAYLQNLPYLIDVASLFTERNLGWSPEFSRAMMTKGLGVDKLTGGDELNDETIARIVTKKGREIPSVAFFRKIGAEAGSYFGITVQRALFISTTRVGEVSVLDHVLRSINMEERGRKRGRFCVQLALALHPARAYIHKTGNPIAAHTNQKSDLLIQAGRIPWDGASEEGSLEREVHEKAFRLIRLDDTRKMEPTGVIRNDYLEPNRGFDPSALRAGALRTWEYMKNVLKMDPLDSVMPFYWVNKPALKTL